MGLFRQRRCSTAGSVWCCADKASAPGEKEEGMGLGGKEEGIGNNGTSNVNNTTLTTNLEMRSFEVTAKGYVSPRMLRQPNLRNLAQLKCNTAQNCLYERPIYHTASPVVSCSTVMCNLRFFLEDCTRNIPFRNP